MSIEKTEQPLELWEDWRVAVDRYLAEHQRRITDLMFPTPDLQSVTNQRFAELAEAVMSHDNTFLPPGNMAGLRYAITDIFLDCRYIKPTVRHSTGRAHLRWQDPAVINPKKASVLIDLFGLADGVRKSYQEIADRFEVSEERVLQATERSLTALRLPPNRDRIVRYGYASKQP